MTTVSRRTVATHLAGVSSSSSVSNATFALLLQSLLTRMISTDFHKECRHLRSHPLLRRTHGYGVPQTGILFIH
ncbi:hypothetical protein ZEAMMB73_Zm00001d052972 [Zea mays]|uniref:Uncharacterized protein n=1 Tax=Zea mays TaxID=4577 RepID=B4FL44_MAIZE|nr:unknown [Zea mays]AQK58453.1 hypothetical protein ZEAMMB73_Zm00001d052972 [Zea mays]